MAGIVDRLMRFARSPQGQRAITQARRAAADPRNQAKLQRLLSKLRTRR
jgi:hypothetical protein